MLGRPRILLSGTRVAAAAVALLTVAVLTVAVAGCGGSSAKHSGAAQSGATSSTASTPVTHTAPAKTVTVTSTSQAPAAPGLATCPTSRLTLSFAGGEGAAGTEYMRYRLTNQGSTACVLFGYPGVAILDSAGHIVQHPAARRPGQAVRRVTLKPGAAAQFLLTSSNVIPSPGCQHSWTGATLQVIPPNQRAPLRRPYTTPFCNLTVGPVQPA